MHYAGSLDSSFGMNGYSINANIGSNGLLVLANDMLLMTGDGIGGGPSLSRFLKNGTLDQSFGINGVDNIKVTVRAPSYAACILVQSDGKILLGGAGYDTAASSSHPNGTANDFLTLRLLPDGSLDTTFNHTGIVVTDFYYGQDNITGLALQPDGKIIASGTVGSSGIGLIRYNTTGSVDTTFCNCSTGEVIAHLPNTTGIFGNAMVLQSDGKIVVGGSADNGGNHQYLLLRYTTDGTLDTSYGTSGVVRTDINGDYDEIDAMQLLPDGKILAAGTSSLPNTGLDFALVKYTTTGSVDSSFGVHGSVTTDVDNIKTDVATSIALEPDGRIVLAGRSFGNGFYEQAIVRYTATGKVDSTFGNYGIVHNQVGTQNSLKAVQIQSNGKIIVAGSMQNTTSTGYALLARYQAENNTGLTRITNTGTNDFEMYPNPVTNDFFITNASYKSTATIVVTDMLGKVVLVTAHDFGKSPKTSVDVSNYASGTYNVQITSLSGDGTQVFKIIKN